MNLPTFHIYKPWRCFTQDNTTQQQNIEFWNSLSPEEVDSEPLWEVNNSVGAALGVSVKYLFEIFVLPRATLRNNNNFFYDIQHVRTTSKASGCGI